MKFFEQTGFDFSPSRNLIPHNHITEQFHMVVIKTTFPMLGFLVSDKRHEWNGSGSKLPGHTAHLLLALVLLLFQGKEMLQAECLCPRQFLCWDPSPQCEGVGGNWAFGRWWGHEGATLTNGISALIRKDPRELSPSLSAKQGPWRKQSSATASKSSLEPNHAWHPDPQTVRNKATQPRLTLCKTLWIFYISNFMRE